MFSFETHMYWLTAAKVLSFDYRLELHVSLRTWLVSLNILYIHVGVRIVFLRKPTTDQTGSQPLPINDVVK